MLTSSTDIGGYHPNADEAKWPVGSIFANEGQRLYDLVRQYKPRKIIEVGTRWGCSTQWLAAACRDNKIGQVYTYDIEDLHHPWPEDLAPYIVFTHDSYFKEPIHTCDLLFEDGAHTTGFTAKVLSGTKAKVIAVHDYKHWDCVKTVFDEANEVLGEPSEVFFESPSDCGLAIYIKS